MSDFKWECSGCLCTESLLPTMRYFSYNMIKVYSFHPSLHMSTWMKLFLPALSFCSSLTALIDTCFLFGAQCKLLHKLKHFPYTSMNIFSIEHPSSSLHFPKYLSQGNIETQKHVSISCYKTCFRKESQICCSLLIHRVSHSVHRVPGA